MPLLSLALCGHSVFPAALAAAAIVIALLASQYVYQRERRRRLWLSLQSNRFEPGVEPSPGGSGPEISSKPPAPFPDGNQPPKDVPVPFPPFGRFAREHLGSYSLALLFVGMALVLRWLLEPALQGRLPFSFFLLAVVAAALVTNAWETLLALLLGFLMAVWFFVGPPGFKIGGVDGWWGAALYLLTGVGILWFMKSEHSAWLQTLDRDIAYFDRLKELDRERAARHQHAERERLANLVDSAHDAILSLTPGGRIATWNPATETLLGFTAREAIGQPLALILPSTPQSQPPPLLAQLDRAECSGNWQMALNTKSGTPVEVSLVLSPLKDPLGQLLGASLIVRLRSPRQ